MTDKVLIDANKLADLLKLQEIVKDIWVECSYFEFYDKDHGGSLDFSDLRSTLEALKNLEVVAVTSKLFTDGGSVDPSEKLKADFRAEAARKIDQLERQELERIRSGDNKER